MKELCPQSRFLRRAQLPGHKFVYDGYPDFLRKKSLANIIEDKESTVWGGLYEMDEEGISTLDSSEIYRRMYNRKLVKVVDDDGSTHDAFVYYREHRNLCPPSKEYRSMIIDGAKDCNLPEGYTLRITYGLNG